MPVDQRHSCCSVKRQAAAINLDHSFRSYGNAGSTIPTTRSRLLKDYISNTDQDLEMLAFRSAQPKPVGIASPHATVQPQPQPQPQPAPQDSARPALKRAIQSLLKRFSNLARPSSSPSTCAAAYSSSTSAQHACRPSALPPSAKTSRRMPGAAAGRTVIIHEHHHHHHVYDVRYDDLNFTDPDYRYIQDDEDESGRSSDPELHRSERRHSENYSGFMQKYGGIQHPTARNRRFSSEIAAARSHTFGNRTASDPASDPVHGGQ